MRFTRAQTIGRMGQAVSTHLEPVVVDEPRVRPHGQHHGNARAPDVALRGGIADAGADGRHKVGHAAMRPVDALEILIYRDGASKEKAYDGRNGPQVGRVDVRQHKDGPALPHGQLFSLCTVGDGYGLMEFGRNLMLPRCAVIADSDGSVQYC